MVKVILNILCVVGLLLWSCLFAIGYSYRYGFLLVVSVILLLVVLLGMGTIVFLLYDWANPRGRFSKKDAEKKELISLIVYAFCAILTAICFFHFWAVEIDMKTEAQRQAREKITQLQKVFAEDSVEGSYGYYVEKVSEQYKNGLKYEDVYTKVVRMISFRDALKGKNNSNERYSSLRNQAIEELRFALNAVNKWNPLNVTVDLVSLDDKSQYYLCVLDSLNKQEEWVIINNAYFKYDSVCKTRVSVLVMNPEYSVGSIAISIVLFIVLQLMILSPYLKSKDWRPSPKPIINEKLFKKYISPSNRKEV